MFIVTIFIILFAQVENQAYRKTVKVKQLEPDSKAQRGVLTNALKYYSIFLVSHKQLQQLKTVE